MTIEEIRAYIALCETGDDDAEFQLRLLWAETDETHAVWSALVTQGGTTIADYDEWTDSCESTKHFDDWLDTKA